MTTSQRLELAQRFFDEGRYAACLRLVEPLTLRAPRTKDDLTAQRLLARSAYAVGKLVVAQTAAERVLRRRPQDAETMRLLVRVLQREGRHVDAARWMTRLDELGTDTWTDDSAMPTGPRRPAGAARRSTVA
ncbi:MAG: tetratricopeptide repeat protein [Tetrasphaera sp.]